MTVKLAELDPGTGGWFGDKPWDSEFCRRENHIDPPEGQCCVSCFFPIEETSHGFVLPTAEGTWSYWHAACYYESLTDSQATVLVEDRLDGESFDTW